MTPEEYDKIRKDLDFIIQQTQAIHGFLFGNQEHENPARTQLRDLSTKLETQAQRIAMLESAANANKVDKIQTLWGLASKAGGIIYSAIITAILVYILAAQPSAASDSIPPTPAAKESVEKTINHSEKSNNPLP